MAGPVAARTAAHGAVLLLIQMLEDERLVKADTEKAAELAAVEAAEVRFRPSVLV